MKNLFIFSINNRASKFGIGTYIKQLVSSVRDSGMNVYVVTLSANVKVLERSKVDKITYIDIPKPRYAKNYTETDYLERIHNALVIFLQSYIKPQEINIFHINYLKSNLLAEKLKKNYGGCVVLTLHYTQWSFDLYGDKKLLKRALENPDAIRHRSMLDVINSFNLEKELFGYCDRIIGVSRHSVDDLKELYNVEADKIDLIEHGIRHINPISIAKKQQLRKRYGFKDSDTVLIYAGRIDYVKGVDFLIKSFEKIVQDYPDSYLLIAGSGNYDELLSKTRSLAKNIIFTGFVDQNKLFELYSLSDIGILPSRHEEFGYVALEMMMQKLPVLANNTTGLADRIQHGKTGYLVDIFKPQGLSRLVALLCELIENKQAREYIGIEARRYSLHHYSHQLFKKKMLEFYAKLS